MGRGQIYGYDSVLELGGRETQRQRETEGGGGGPIYLYGDRRFIRLQVRPLPLVKGCR